MSQAFALFIDLTAGSGGQATQAQRVIPFPNAANVTLSLVCGIAPGGVTTFSVTFMDKDGDGVPVPSQTSGQVLAGIVMSPTPVPPFAVMALVELTFPAANFPAVTALVQFD